MDGTNVTATPERARKAGDRMQRAIVDMDTARRADRVLPVIDAMHKRGQLTDEELAAAEQMQRWLRGARAVPGLVSRYGATAGGCDGDAEVWRMHCADRIAGISRAIGVFAVSVLENVINEEWPLSVIGTTYMGFRAQPAASAAGASMVKMALGQLARHLGMTQGAENAR